MKFTGTSEPKALGKRREASPEDQPAKRHKELVASLQAVREAVKQHTDPAFKEGVAEILQGLDELGRQLAALKSEQPRKKWKFTVKRGGNGLIQSIEAE